MPDFLSLSSQIRSSRRGFLQAAGAAATAATGAVLLGGCGDAGGTSVGGAGNGAGGKALAAKGNGQSLKVAIGNEPPYTKMNADGTVTGCEPDVLQAVLTSMGYGKVEPVVAGYDAMIAGLNARRWDVIAAGLFMKQSRCEAVAYTEPVIVSTESFAVLPGNPKKITTVAHVKSDSLIKCAVIGGGFEDGILQTAEVPTDQVVKVKDGVSGVAALKAGRCDAFLLPTLSCSRSPPADSRSPT